MLLQRFPNLFKGEQLILEEAIIAQSSLADLFMDQAKENGLTVTGTGTCAQLP
jgi:hypothetical protein